MIIYGIHFVYQEIDNFGKHEEIIEKYKKITEDEESDEKTPLLKENEDLEKIIGKTWETLQGFYQRLPNEIPFEQEKNMCHLCDFYIGVENKHVKTYNINDIKQQIFKICDKYNLQYKSLNLYTI